jgi:hypothetical protein
MTDYTLFGQVPPGPDGGDTDNYTLGMVFSTDTPLYAEGVWFYKYAGNTGTHQGTLWDDSDQSLITTVTFSGETASGWQYMAFPTNPLLDVFPATYTVSYTCPNGHYAATAGGFTPDITAGPITGFIGHFKNPLPEAYPTDEFGQGNYWVDIQLTDTLTAEFVRPTVQVANTAAVSRASRW